MRYPLSFTLNGLPVEVLVKPTDTLLDVLREKLGVVSAKRGCDWPSGYNPLMEVAFPSPPFIFPADRGFQGALIILDRRPLVFSREPFSREIVHSLPGVYKRFITWGLVM